MRFVSSLRLLSVCVSSGVLAVCNAQSGLTVDVQPGRSQGDLYSATDQAVRKFTKNAAALTRRSREAQGSTVVFSLPTTVRITVNGAPLRSPTGRGEDISLQFGAGNRAFPPDYQTFLQTVFAKAKATLSALFGQPSVGGVVLVSNYDADIGDRDAVAGGYYLANNGSGQQEIRFPFYSDVSGFKREVTAVNFINCLLLAYLGPKSYPFDAFNEGLSRAVTMRVARTPSALPADLDQELVTQVLEATYDVGPGYDWCNQSALGGPIFIAPNLRDAPLPPGGSIGGLYLLRYQMAGSAWQKVLIEYPGFASTMNAAYYANPSSFNTPAKLSELVQTTIGSLGGSSIEGVPATLWVKQQYILQTATIPGQKLLVQPFPIVSGLSGDDYGVFGIQAHYFSTAANGNEQLLTGTCFPIFWGPDFTRFFTSGQDDRADILEGYGAVAPNFPDSIGVPYRVAVDMPVSDRIARCYLPAGAIAVAGQATVNNFYGTITGVQPANGVDYIVRASWTNGASGDIPATGLAFGALLTTGNFDSSQRLTVTVSRRIGLSESVILTRTVNKGPGSIGLDLRIDQSNTYSLPGGLAKGLSMIGFPIAPYSTDPAEVLGVPQNEALIARYDSESGKYAIYPDSGSFVQGGGYFVRANAGQSLSVEGRSDPNTSMAVALKPGWNMISCPLQSEVPTSQLQVVVAAGFPTSYPEAIGNTIGSEFFSFTPGNPDPVTGAPEGGTFTPATKFVPGKAYFVRVLAPEGLTLLFSPSTSNRPGNFGSMRGRSSWTMRVGLKGGDEETEVRIGEARGASRGLDDQFDSPLPPSVGVGLQGQVFDHGRLFRDMRQWGRAETFKVRFDSLIPGELYRVRFTMFESGIDRYTVKDPEAGKTRKYTQAGSYTFRATSKSKVLEISVPGWK